MPSATPAVVSCCRPVASLTALATPKSVTSAWRPGEQHVVGLDVAVHHAPGVGVRQGVGHLDQDLDRLVDRQLALDGSSRCAEVLPSTKGIT